MCYLPVWAVKVYSCCGAHTHIHSCLWQESTECQMHTYGSLVPRLPLINVTCRERKEPGKMYHMCDVGVEATWSAAG